MKIIKLNSVLDKKITIKGYKLQANRKGTLKLLTPKIQKLIHLAIKHTNSNKFIKIAKKKRNIKSIDVCCAKVLLDVKDGIIFKVGGTHIGNDDDVPNGEITFLEDSVDTIFIWCKGNYSRPIIRIQPKVELDEYANVAKALRKFGKKYNNCDIHSGNIGRYKGKMVLFDW